MSSSARKPALIQREEIESGNPQRVVTYLQNLNKSNLNANLYVTLLVLTDTCGVLNDPQKVEIRKVIFQDLSDNIDKNARTSGRSPQERGARGVARPNPGNPQGSSPELDIRKVHNVFMQQTIGPKGKLGVERVFDLWKCQHARLFLLSGVLKDVVNKGSPPILEHIMQMARKILSGDQQAALICDTREDGRSGTALSLAIARLDVPFTKILIKERTQPHVLDMKNPHQDKDTALHSIIKDTEKPDTGPEETQCARQEKMQQARLDIIQAMIEERPSILWAHDKFKYPPFSYARQLNLPDIESLLRDSIFERLKEAHSIRKALYGPKGKSHALAFNIYKELCLDMSDFNQISHDFTAFVQLLREYAPKGSYSELLLKDFEFFEKKLLYVYLPDFQVFADDLAHDCIRELFTWLKIQGVESIMDLSIPDNPTRPMSEDFVVENILKKFSIRRLDWRKLDIDLSALRSDEGEVKQQPHTIQRIGSGFSEPADITQNLTNLKLYSSGNRGVLYHWASADGLCYFKKLRNVTIEVLEPKVMKETFDRRMAVNEKKFAGLLEETYKNLGVTPPDIKFESTCGWSELVPQESELDTIPIDNLKIFNNFDLYKEVLYNIIEKKESDPFGADEAYMLSDNPIRIAIIDNGVDKVRTTLFKNIENGISFVKTPSGNRILPWWMVADPHGTQMASLVQNVNPYCRLYIARVGKRRNDIDCDRAAEAIRWAVKQGVHIISISWITRRKSDKLEKAVKHATKSDVLIFCSTADAGPGDDKVWPADYDETISVSASDLHGRPRPQSRDNADLLVDGEDIVAEGPVYIKKYTKGPVSGSSVATALAAGIASLGLTLAQLANDDPQVFCEPYSTQKRPPSDAFRDKKMMLKIFRLMGKKGRRLRPSKLFIDGFERRAPGILASGKAHDSLPEWVQRLKVKRFKDTADAEISDGADESDESDEEDVMSDED